MSNKGVILRIPTKEDYKFGGVNGIYNNIFNESGNWLSYLPTDEIQRFDGVETYSCVTQSAHNCLEIILSYLEKHNKLDQEDIEFLKDYKDNNGKYNFSDRFTAKMSGTSYGGNTLYNVAESIRKNGLLSEKDYPFTKGTFVEYYKEIDEDLKEKAKLFLERFSVGYETVNSKDFAEAIKYAPLQVIVYAWKRNEDGFYINNGGNFNHAVSLILAKPSDIYDTYSPFIKTLAENYEFWQTAYKFNITKKITSKPMKIINNYLYKLVEGNEQIIALGLDGKLMWNDGDKGKIETFLEFVGRNNGDMTGKVVSVSLADWNSVPHFDLKNNKK